jgi:hypothetical protein
MNLCILFGTDQSAEVEMLYYVSTRPSFGSRGMKSTRPPVLRGRAACGTEYGVCLELRNLVRQGASIKRGSLGGFLS